MAGIGLTLKWIGMDKLMAKFGSKETIDKPTDDGIRKLATSAKAELTKATVVDTGTARSNIASASIQYAAFQAIVTHSAGPGQKYIPYLETGTNKMEARHMEGGSKVLGEGMFSYVRRWLAGKMEDAAKSIASDIEDKF